MTIDADRLNEIRKWADNHARFLLAALDAAEQRAAQPEGHWAAMAVRERERREQAERPTKKTEDALVHLREAEARALQAEQERDEARQERNDQGIQAEHFQQRAEAAEARTTKLETALREHVGNALTDVVLADLAAEEKT